MSEWRPIETAPTTGRRVLLWCSFDYCDGHAVSGYYDFDEAPARLLDGTLSPSEGWRGDGDMCIPRNQEVFTHWMPLPEPPK